VLSVWRGWEAPVAVDLPDRARRRLARGRPDRPDRPDGRRALRRRAP
jgi:hypothetical protein